MALLEWEVPSDLCATAGNIEISISFFDKKDGEVVYSWNTANYSGLSVGQTMNSVESFFPAKDEILMIDKESKNIIAPTGYNNVICNYGDVGVANVYFLVSRYLGKKNVLDVLDDSTRIVVYVQMNGYRRKQTLTATPYAATVGKNEGFAFIQWEVPPDFTAGDFGAHKMIVAIEFSQLGADGEILKRWFSNTYTQLEVAPSAIQIDDPGEGDIPITEDIIYHLIEDYFVVNEVVWDPND